MSRCRPQVVCGRALGIIFVAIIGLLLAGCTRAPASPPLIAPTTAVRNESATPGPRGASLPATRPAVTETRTSNVLTPLARATYAVPVPPPGGSVANLPADPQRVGWVSQGGAGTGVAASFPDFNVYAGNLRGRTYTGAVSFDLAPLSEYGPTTAAEIVLFGLSDDYKKPSGGVWTVEALADDSLFWKVPGFDVLAGAPAASVLATFQPAELAFNHPVRIPLNAEALNVLNSLRYRGRSLTLRLRGPTGNESLFGFDGGTGSGSLGNPPRLLVSTGPGQATPTPILVTATPTPVNALTAAVRIVQRTAEATTTGTPTPPPFNWVVVAPAADGKDSAVWRDANGTPLPVFTAQAAPANEATASYHALVATAEALTTGTPTPLPNRYVTATPSLTPVFVVSTPTPENVVGYADSLLTATVEAQSTGTPTPLPPNARLVTATPVWIVVTATPTAENAATEIARSKWAVREATAIAMTTGTATPRPPNFAVATPPPPPTPLPLLIYSLTPRPTPTPTVQGGAMPAAFRGKILFRSNRDGDTRLFLLDPATGAVAWVTQEWPFTVAATTEGQRADGRYRIFVKTVPDTQRLQLFVWDNVYNTERQITAEANGSRYDAVWSPTSERIAYVSTEPGNDEIFTLSPDGANRRQLTVNNWEWDKHPSWSPDGTQIVFWSNRETGRAQLWVMNADGSGQRRLLNSPYSDWDPIWVK